MAFLRLNGWEIPVFDASPRERVERSGRRGRSHRGQMRDARRAVRRSWTMRACVLDHDSAATLRHMLNGEGHLCDFRYGVEGSTSLMPRPGHANALRLNPAAWGAHGRGVAHAATAASGVLIAYDAQLGDEWTVLCRRYVSGAFIGCAVRSDGTSYVGGAASSTFGLPYSAGGAGLRFDVRGGVLEVVKDQTAGPEIIDDLQILPWRVADSALAAMTAATDEVPKPGPWPVLRADGDVIDPGGSSSTVLGSVVSMERIGKQHHVNGLGWVSNAAIVTFTLDELDPRFTASIDGDEIETPVPPGAPIAWFDAGNVDGWLNASTADAAAVSGWVDMGSRGVSLTQGTSGYRPTFRKLATPGRLNSGPAVRFDGTDDRLSTGAAAPNVASPVTIAAVWRPTGVAGTQYVVDRASGADVRARLYAVATAQTIADESDTDAHATALTAAWNMSIARFAAADSEHRLNGVAETVATDLSDTTGTFGLTVGASDAGASFLGGDVACVIVWSGDVDLDEIEAFLTARFGSEWPG